MTTTKVVLQEGTVNPGQDFDGGGSVTLQQDAFILATGHNGISANDGPWAFIIDGVILSDLNGLAIFNLGLAAPIKNSTITVGTEGVIVGGAGKDGIDSSLAVDIVNSGVIQGDVYGIDLDLTAPSSTKVLTITNNKDGQMLGATDGIHDTDTTHSLTVKNQGTVDGMDWTGSANITNSGDMLGPGLIQDSSAVTYADTITNSGYIAGAVNTAGGNDVVKNSGTIVSAVQLYDGNDSLNNTGTIFDQVDLGAGNNSVTNSGTIVGTVIFAGGDDKVANTGKIVGNIGLGDGNNTLTNGGTLAMVFFGAGTDSMNNTGSVVSVDMGKGVNHLINSGTIGIVGFGINASSAFSNSGAITGDVTSVGDGTNKYTNSGTIGGRVFAEESDDTLVNSKLITGYVNLGDGHNIVTNSGTIQGYLTTGGGNDVITITGKIASDITLGDGNDTLTGGNSREAVRDGNGDDVYKLGGGNDYCSFAASGKDVFDGGAGNDEIDASAVPGVVWVNLDTKSITLAGQTLAASSIHALASTGTVKNFEQVDGSIGSDNIIAGSAAKEYLYGGGGADTIYGGGGADLIHGAGNADTFVYLHITDSGTTKATRDEIYGFDGAGVSGGDVIDLSAIDADTKTAGDKFHLIGGDTAFTKNPGELRWMHVLGDTIVEGDVNGDGKADISIDVTGTHDFIATDFAL